MAVHLGTSTISSRDGPTIPLLVHSSSGASHIRTWTLILPQARQAFGRQDLYRARIMGVIPMVLRLFIGPFSQQTLWLSTWLIPQGDRGNTTMPRAVIYDSFEENRNVNIKANGVSYPNVKFPMQVVMPTDLSRTGSSYPDVQGRSSTGHCSLESFSRQTEWISSITAYTRKSPKSLKP